MADRPGRSRRRGPRKTTEPAQEYDPPEGLLAELRGIGASLFLTDRQLILARDGAERRPRTGVQALDLHEIRHIRIELGSAPSGRIAVWTSDEREALSMFFHGRALDRAHELLDAARPLIARSRRERRASRDAGL